MYDDDDHNQIPNNTNTNNLHIFIYPAFLFIIFCDVQHHLSCPVHVSYGKWCVQCTVSVQVTGADRSLSVFSFIETRIPVKS